MSNIIKDRLGLGQAGQISRSVDFVVSAKISSEVEDIMFGEPVGLMSDNTVVSFVRNPASKFIGFAVMATKQNMSMSTVLNSYKTGDVIDVMERGSMFVNFDGAVPAVAGGKAFATLVGDQVVITDAGTELPDVVFATGEVYDNIAEITVLVRH